MYLVAWDSPSYAANYLTDSRTPLEAVHAIADEVRGWNETSDVDVADIRIATVDAPKKSGFIAVFQLKLSFTWKQHREHREVTVYELDYSRSVWRI